MTVDPFIEAEEVAGHGATRACRLLEVSRSAYYERKKAIPSARATTDAELTARIREVHDESKGTYGYLRVRRALADEGVCVGKWRVRRLMRASGLEGRAKKRWRTTTVADPEAEAAKDLIQRHFGPCEELDRRYAGDITYIGTWEGWAYLATVIDLASLADESGTSPCRLRVHRGLVQHPPSAQLARLHEPRQIRSTHPPQRRPSGGMINTTNLSVEPGQAQSRTDRCSGSCVTAYAPRCR
jgi:HTH-like domain